MSKIVCATRGGEGSRAVQMAAIEEAQSSGRSLVFLYITASDSVTQANMTLQTAVSAELSWIGQALLRIAQKRANAAGINAELVIRKGQVREEIVSYLQETDADLMLLGAPRGTTLHIIGDDVIERFAQFIESSTGVPTKVIRPEREVRAERDVQTDQDAT